MQNYHIAWYNGLHLPARIWHTSHYTPINVYLVPDGQLCCSNLIAIFNHSVFKVRKSSSTNLQVVSPATRMKPGVQSTLLQMPQHFIADSSKNMITSVKWMARTTQTPGFLGALCHVYTYHSARACKNNSMNLSNARNGGKGRLLAAKSNKIQDLPKNFIGHASKKFQVLLCKGSVLSWNMPRSAQAGSQAVLTRRGTAYACQGALRLQHRCQTPALPSAPSKPGELGTAHQTAYLSSGSDIVQAIGRTGRIAGAPQ